MKRTSMAALLASGIAVVRLVAGPIPTIAITHSTYLGGGGGGYRTDSGNAIAVGADGAVYILGQTGSSPFPHTAVVPPDGPSDGNGSFVAKLSADGKSRVYSTFIPGVAGRAMAVDAAGSVYITGETSGLLPGTSTAQAQFGGSSDAFVLKLTPDGRSAAYATFLGGSDLELGRGIAVDPAGNAYVVGWTTSTNLPVTPGAAQPAIGGGYDAFVAKLNPDGTRFVYVTYLGGAAQESGAAIALDAQRRAVVVGRTASTSFAAGPVPTRFGADKRSFDAYVARVNADGTALDYVSLIAGEAFDAAARVAIASDGSPVVLGHTESAQFPVTAGAHRTVHAGNRDLFVARIAPNGAALTFCTYLGTDAQDSVGAQQYAGGYRVGDRFEDGTSLETEAGGLALDADDNVLVCATTWADAWPGAAGISRGSPDAVAMKLSATGERLIWLNFAGGRADDYGQGLAHDGHGGAWITGEATRPFLPPYFPTTGDATQPRFGGGVSDAYALRLELPAPVPANDAFAGRLAMVGSRVTTTANNSGAGKEPGEPDHAANAGGKSLWWTWTAPADGKLSVDATGSTFPALVAAYTGDTLPALQAVPTLPPGTGVGAGKLRIPVVAGRTYILAVDGLDGASGDVLLSLTFSAPANDDFGDRIVLGGFPVIATGSNVDATAEGPWDAAKAGVPGGQSVWWEWTSPTNGVVAVSTSGSSFDTTLAVFVGTTTADLVEVQGNDNASNQPGQDGTSRVTFLAVAGTRYFIAVDGYYFESGTIRLDLEPGDPPANDDFSNRAILEGYFAKVRASNRNATLEAPKGESLLVTTNRIGDPDGNSAGYTVWWTWTSPTNGQARLFTSDITFDTRLGIFTGDTLDTLRPVATSDNRGGSPFDYASDVVFPAGAGTRYQIVVDGNVYGSHSGAFTLNLLLQRPPVIQPGSLAVDPGGMVRFRVQGLPGVAYRVETCGSLGQWIPGNTVVSDTEFFEVTDSPGAADRVRFYRLVIVE